MAKSMRPGARKKNGTKRMASMAAAGRKRAVKGK